MSDKTDALRKRLEEGCKPPTWDDIETALEEVERLENDLADALDLKAGHGPTALASVVAERDAAQALAEHRAKALAECKRLADAATDELEAALDRIAGLYLHEGVTQDDETTVRKMYETALAALGRA